MNNEQRLAGKTVVVSGATSGIGWESLLALAGEGAAVIGIGRSAERCRQAEERLRAAYPQVRAAYCLADLSSQAQVRRAAAEIRGLLTGGDFPPLAALVNNAGIYAERRVWTEDGVESTFAVNHLAAFLLTLELMDNLRAAPGGGRVVTVSSASHYRTWMNPEQAAHPRLYFGLWAYKVSKLANVLFTYELNRRCPAQELRAFAVDPGLIRTDIGVKGPRGISTWVWAQRAKKGRPPQVPAQTVVHCCAQAGLQTSADFYWRDLQPKTPSRTAQRADVAAELWAVSRALCGLAGE